MTPQQAAQLLQQHGAAFVTTKDGVEWWRLPDQTWLGKRALQNGLVEVRKFTANACGC